MRKKWLLLGVCLPLSLLCGRELFVSPSGSNKNPGTAKAPFKTIAFAASKAMPGDTVKIGPGIYREAYREPRPSYLDAIHRSNP